MIDYMIQLLVALAIFMIINKHEWGRMLWTALNKRVKPRYDLAIFFVALCLIAIAARLLCIMSGIPFNSIAVAILLGCCLAFMPPVIPREKSGWEGKHNMRN